MADALYSRDQVDDWQQRLEVIAQQPRTTFTKRQVVEELFDTIEQALETRSYQEVADSLADWGLDISEGSLKQYLARLRKAQKTKASSSRKRTAQTQISVASTSQEEAGAAAKTSVARSTGVAATSRKAATQDARTGKKQAKKNASAKPKRFLEMPEDL